VNSTFTKDYTLLVGLKYYIKLSTKLLSKEMLSTYIDLRRILRSKGASGSLGSRSLGALGSLGSF
jgi:hypothetical protein